MKKFLPGIAAAALVFALAAPATAAPQRTDGVTDPGVTDMSAKRKKKRVVIREYDDEPSYRYRTYRSYGAYPHRGYGYDHPYRAYGYQPRSGVSVGVGGFGVQID